MKNIYFIRWFSPTWKRWCEEIVEGYANAQEFKWNLKNLDNVKVVKVIKYIP